MINVQALQRALKSAMLNLEHFSMHRYAFTNDSVEELQRLSRQEPPACGTTLCLAGWICYNEKPEVLMQGDFKIRDAALEIICGSAEGEKAESLMDIFNMTYSPLAEVQAYVEEFIAEYEDVS